MQNVSSKMITIAFTPAAPRDPDKWGEIHGDYIDLPDVRPLADDDLRRLRIAAIDECERRASIAGNTDGVPPTLVDLYSGAVITIDNFTCLGRDDSSADEGGDSAAALETAKWTIENFDKIARARHMTAELDRLVATRARQAEELDAAIAAKKAELARMETAS